MWMLARPASIPLAIVSCSAAAGGAAASLSCQRVHRLSPRPGRRCWRIPGWLRYQAIASQALELRGLGYPDTLIAACTGVTPKTVAKAIRWLENQSSDLH